MKESEAKRQLCKMTGEVADRLGVKSRCICSDTTTAAVGEVPDEVISELWELIADGYLFRYVREIFRQERPKGRRLNVEELTETLPVRNGRWVVLKKTTNSGKTLFACTVCGRVSTTPDKDCRTLEDPDETWGCSAAEGGSKCT